MEEGASITEMARHHPDMRLRMFLQKYVSYIGTNTVRLGNYVEIAREEALQDAVMNVQNYTGSANTIFFVGTMMASVLPVMLTVMAFLPSSGINTQSLMAVTFALPMIFVLFPVLMSTGTMFLQTEGKVHMLSCIAGTASFCVLYAAVPGLWILDASVGITVFAGMNWAKTARKERRVQAADREIPDMLDYIAEQKKSKDSMVEIFQDYAQLPNSNSVLQELLQSIASDIMIKSTYDAFFAHRCFPNKTIKFVFFILHAIYEHGGGTYETTIAMAHSIRRIAEIKSQFASSKILSRDSDLVPCSLYVLGDDDIFYDVWSARYSRRWECEYCRKRSGNKDDRRSGHGRVAKAGIADHCSGRRTLGLKDHKLYVQAYKVPFFGHCGLICLSGIMGYDICVYAVAVSDDVGRSVRIARTPCRRRRQKEAGCHQIFRPAQVLPVPGSRLARQVASVRQSKDV